MLDFQAAFTTNGVAFPATAAINVSAPGAADGTEVTANTLNDVWGFFQGLLDYAGLTPSGSLETASNSQLLQALQYGFLPAGMVVGWYGQNYDPDSLGYRFLKLHGQGILRANYADLDSAVYVGDSNNPTAEAFYRSDDAPGAVRNTTGIYLQLPDTRGKFLRGDTELSGTDPDVRNFPDTQAHAFQNHSHYVRSGTLYYDRQDYTLSAGATVSTRGDTPVPSSSSALLAGTLQQGTGHALETRPVNMGVKWVIKY